MQNYTKKKDKATFRAQKKLKEARGARSTDPASFSYLRRHTRRKDFIIGGGGDGLKRLAADGEGLRFVKREDKLL